jgi:hypothetical protein
MPSPGNGAQHYQIHYSKAVGNFLRGLQRKAAREGRGNAFALALRRIAVALQKSPMKAGEPLYRLSAMRLQVRTIVIAPLAIDFAVSEDLPHVYIKSGRLLSR